MLLWLHEFISIDIEVLLITLLSSTTCMFWFDFFPFLLFSKLICSFCFHFLICVLVLRVQWLVCTGGGFCRLVCYWLWYCVLLYVFLVGWNLVQCIFLMSFLFLLFPGKWSFLPYILLLLRGIFVYVCIIEEILLLE